MADDMMETLDDPVCFMPGCDRPNPKWECGLAWTAFLTIDEPQASEDGSVMFMPKLVRFCSRQCAEVWMEAENVHAFDNDRKFGMHPDLHEKYVAMLAGGSALSFCYHRGDYEQAHSSLQHEDYDGILEYEFDRPDHPRPTKPDLSTPLAVIEAGAKPEVPSDGAHWPPLQPRREP